MFSRTYERDPSQVSDTKLTIKITYPYAVSGSPPCAVCIRVRLVGLGIPFVATHPLGTEHIVVPTTATPVCYYQNPFAQAADLNNWINYGDSWSIANNVLRQNGNLYDGRDCAADRIGSQFVYLAENFTASFELSVDMRTEDDDCI
eukprot:gene7452-biopygen10577